MNKESKESKRGKLIGSITIAIITGIIATILTNYLILKYDERYYAHRYDDTKLAEDKKRELQEDGETFTITQLGKADLHGLDHNSLIIAGINEENHEGEDYWWHSEAKLAIYEKPEKDYSAVLDLESPANLERPNSRFSSIRFRSEDINCDGRDEILIMANDSYASGLDTYSAIIGWDSGYRVLWTPPILDLYENSYCKEELHKAGIKLWGQDAYDKIKDNQDDSYNGTDLWITQNGVRDTCKVGSSTHIELLNIDNDPNVEILCADVVWQEGEGQTGEHSYFVRVYEMGEYWKGHPMYTVEPDPYWNAGDPLLVLEKYPFYEFKFSEHIIELGKMN